MRRVGGSALCTAVLLLRAGGGHGARPNDVPADGGEQGT
eukprot:gene22151-20956_t